jgi:ABC-type transport system involved in cytochrome c biogenesis permease subunit
MGNMWAMVPSALLAALAMGLALLAGLARLWPLGGRVGRFALVAACALGLAVLVTVGAQSSQWPSTSPAVAAASVGVAVGLCSLMWGPQHRAAQVVQALMVALGLGAYLLAPKPALAGGQARGLALGLAEAHFVLGAAALLQGAVTATLNEHSSALVQGRSASAAGLLLLTVSLLFQGIGAQCSWGAYWSWDPVECWRLAAWAMAAIVCLGIWRLGWSRERARLALWLAADE